MPLGSSLLRLLPAIFALSCWAPEVAEPPSEDAPTPPPEAPVTTPGKPAPPEPISHPPPPLPPRAPPPKLSSTPESELSEPPFTAWTTHAPLTPVGPGGVAVAHIKKLGVRIEVVQVLEHRTRFTCAGCTGAEHGVEAWLQPGRLRASGAPGTPDDPLVAALQLRARWAGGNKLPEGASREQMCALVDAGFTWTGSTTATWSLDSGKLVLTWNDGRWSIAEATPPQSGSDCRTQRAQPN